MDSALRNHLMHSCLQGRVRVSKNIPDRCLFHLLPRVTKTAIAGTPILNNYALLLLALESSIHLCHCSFKPLLLILFPCTCAWKIISYFLSAVTLAILGAFPFSVFSSQKQASHSSEVMSLTLCSWSLLILFKGLLPLVHL